MSNYPPKHRGTSDSPTVRPAPPRQGRARWYAAGLAGLTGLAGLAAVGGATEAYGLTNGPGDVGSLPPAARQVLAAQPVAGDPNGNKPADQDTRGNEQSVPCDTGALTAAIVRANASGGARLRLTEHCTYTLTAAQGPDGLPTITQPITLDGVGATIVRAANAANFRILDVGVGGDLTLEDLTVTGGFAPNSNGGGGILVQSGGRVTLRNTTVSRNQSTAVGGGIANYGITTVLGEDGQDKGGHGNSSAPTNGAGNAPANGPTQASPGGESGGKNGGVATDAGTGKALSRVNNNSAQTAGGGIYNDGHLITRNAEVSYNNGGRASGGGITDLGGAVLEKTRIDHNVSSAADGGGIATFGTITSLKQSSVSDNTADGRGGGISCAGSTIYLQGTEVDRNTAGIDGGGIYNQSVPLGGSALAVIEDSEVNGNTATGDGGGIANLSGDLVLRRSHVNLNKTIGTTSQGGGVYNSLGNANLTATEVTRNSSIIAPGGVFNNNEITVDQKSTIIANRPTNCTGSSPAVPNCFG
jgi:hypothetical protein